MRVLQINHLYRAFGGGERYLFDLCSGLEEKGVEVAVLSSRDRENYAYGKGRREFFIDRSFGLRTGFKSRHGVEKIVNDFNPHLIHFHETLTFLSPLIMRRLVHMKPSVQTLHTAFFFAL